MSAVEFDVDGVDTVLPGDEPDSVLVCRTGQRDLVDSLASSDLFKLPYVALKKPQKDTKTFFQLGDDALLQSS